MTEKTVPVDEIFGEMMNWAVRYALGRRTYAVADTCGYIKPLVPYLDDKTLLVMCGDIIEQGDARYPQWGTDWGPYGDPPDEKDWMNLLYTIRAELERRKDNA